MAGGERVVVGAALVGDLAVALGRGLVAADVAGRRRNGVLVLSHLATVLYGGVKNYGGVGLRDVADEERKERKKG
jgi:hypothetical protein